MTTQKNFFRDTPETPGQKCQKVMLGSTAWSGRTIFARDLEPILTRLEPSRTGPRLHLESESFCAVLPASPFILSLLAAKLERTITT